MREAEGDHTGERTSSGVVNMSSASTDHLPEHLSWDAGRKQQGEYRAICLWKNEWQSFAI